ncbi:MAG: response regulator [Lachnospiraceae bacterium]|nr:response regulator [Lachnospiraceae bacterium]
MYRVVIADDEIKVVQLMKKLIDWDVLGYEIVGTANDGISALTMIKKLQPDLLITDIRMPGCSGIELLKSAKEYKEDLICIVVSGYREFEYAQSALKYGAEDYILKPINKNEMTELLYKIRAKLSKGAELAYQIEISNRKKQELLIRNLKEYSEKGLSLGDKTTLNNEYGFQFQTGVSSVLIVKPDIRNGWGERQSYHVLMEHILEIVHQNLPGITDEWAAAILPEGVTAVINSSEKKIRDIKKIAVRIRREIELEKDIFGDFRLTICIGKVQNDISCLYQSMRSAIFLCEDRICSKVNLRIADEESEQTISHFRIETGERVAVQEAVELLVSDEYKKILFKSFDAICMDEHCNGNLIRSWYAAMLDLTLYRLVSFGINGNRIKTELLERYWFCSSPEEVRDMITGYFCRKIEGLRNERKIQEAKPITDAKKYIREHYRESLKLEEVSRAVGFNSTYFSSLFKKETGMNYQDYLTELRMMKAKELLSETNLSLAEVAEQVGYTDLKYFSRLFKRATGINPSEYKKLYS